ncbi:DegT/DnrJ/EryC1/StrS family aminotransferase [Pseudomonas sp. GX19020]|uniref:DegT/DnrJ/EryC1/StrS family aminotransferase n=1 Tax=Pseudomonas sp. GX19020 TaxID=2942277 RepID=UPI002018C446|nr:DegT/DnrJ/EryC1/StrS family aminotransferase [Pseudomonas sp. GX19020]MCL4068476.1 DegT/DnrJ/EryC1/StrS family aminotransferase [Pseudomonas sp. GX19020]
MTSDRPLAPNPAAPVSAAKPARQIPVAAPSITEREGELAREAALNAWGADHYRYNRRFEEMLAAHCGVAHAVSLPHATSGLHLALAALGVGPGDEVIGPDVTWIASMAPVTYVGAVPVFVDILPDTWCLDPVAVEAAITPRTKAIIGVDLYGSMCDWEALRALADRHGIALIEDAAEALGSTYCGRPAGSLGDVAVFSFHGSKTITTGEGGALVTNDPALHARVQKLRDHGRPPGDRFFLNDEVAFKYKMSAVQAALGIAQMERLDALIAYKRQLFGWYADRLRDVPGLAINAEPQEVKNSFWMVTVIPDERYDLDKFALQTALAEQGIDSRPFFSSLSSLKAYADTDCRPLMTPRTETARIVHAGINLPSGYGLDEATVSYICETLKEILQRCARR